MLVSGLIHKEKVHPPFAYYLPTHTGKVLQRVLKNLGHRPHTP